MEKTFKKIATDIVDIRIKRHELADDILQVISEFEEETGQGVKDVELDHERQPSPPDKTVAARVKIARDDGA